MNPASQHSVSSAYPSPAGLFTGVVPVASAVGGVLLGGPVPGPVVWSGVAVVVVGVVLGMRTMSGSESGPPQRPGPNT